MNRRLWIAFGVVIVVLAVGLPIFLVLNGTLSAGGR